MTTGRPQPQRETRTQAVVALVRKHGLDPATAIFTHYATYGATSGT